MRNVIVLALNDLHQLIRERASLFFAVGFPIIFAIFFGMVFSGGGGESGGIAVVLVDEDDSASSRELVESLRNAPELRVMTHHTGELGRSLTRAEALTLVQRGRRSASIVIPKGYGDDQRSIFWGPPREIELGLDPSRRAEIGMLEGVLMRHTFEQFGSVFSDPARLKSEIKRANELLARTPDIDPMRRTLLGGMFASVDLLISDMQPKESSNSEVDAPSPTGFGGLKPVEIRRQEIMAARSGPKNAYSVTFAQAILWGMAGCASAFAISISLERTRGTMLRLRIAPITWATILAGKTLACFLATLSVSLMLLILAKIVFGVTPVSIVMVAAGLICLAVCFSGMMMMLAVLGRSESSSGSFAWAVILVLLMIGGGTIPVFSMPRWMQSLSMFSPVYWGILAVEGGLWRGFSAADMLLPCGILLAVGAGCWLLGTRLIRALEPA